MIYQTIMIAIVGIVMAVFLKSCRPEFGVFMALGIGMIITIGVLSLLVAMKDKMISVMEIVNGDMAYYGVIFKMIGISYLSEFASGICKDAGYSFVSSQIEIFSKITILLAGFPILISLIETIQQFSFR